MSHQLPAATTFAFICLWVVLFTVLGTRGENPRHPVEWDTVANLAYPNEFAADGVAPLTDGVYVYHPDGQPGIEVRLTSIQTYADLRDTGVDDALPLLLTTGTETGNVFDLALVGNVRGEAQVLDHVRVGERVELRSVIPDRDGVRVRLRVFEADDADCCPSREVVRSFGMVDGKLAQVSEREVPFAPPSVSVHEFDPELLAVQPGRWEHFSGVAGENHIVDYLLPVTEGQGVNVSLEGNGVGLSAYSLASGNVYASVGEHQAFQNTAHTSEDMAIRVVPLGWGEREFTLAVEVTNAPTPTPEPTATPEPLPTATPQPAPETPPPPPETSPPAPPTQAPAPPPQPPAPRPMDGTVYLTFDDGPSAATYAILDVLDRYGARATFFVLGSQVAMHPDAVMRAAASGHLIGNHSYWHNSLVGMSRDVFMTDIGATQAIIEQYAGGAATRCLRPPFGATDAVSQAYAAEMGLHTILWTIDTQDWRNPGVDAIVNEVLSRVTGFGDVVLMHDATGDRSQTVQALERIIPELQSWGLRFEALSC